MITPPAPARSFDLVLVGGGLANGLIALAATARNPSRSVALVEAEPRLGGQHTWSFHASDVPAEAANLLGPLVEHSWPRYSVSFPELRRTIDIGYASFRSQSLHAAVSERLLGASQHALLLGQAAVEVSPHKVVLSDGRVLEAELVIDGRGPERHRPGLGCRFQKFVGLELALAARSPELDPVLMDAQVDQSEGLRFVYVLPFEERRVLIEDTYFSDDSSLDDARLEARIMGYARTRGYAVQRILRRERGVLPLPLRGPRSEARPGLLSSGFAGGWFHPTTGYSLPLALRLALFVATHTSAGATGVAFDAMVRERNRQQRFFCMLNRLLYGAFAPERRFEVMQRFYGLPEDTIGRFYSLETTGVDRLRILCGRPPSGFSLTQALTQARSP
jgi:lycopene beta-cyclase